MRNESEFEEEYDDEHVLRGAILRSSLGDIPRRPLVTVPDTSTVIQTIQAMNEKRVGAALITRDGKLVGIFTERDVLKRVAAHDVDVDTTPVAQVMTKDPDTLPFDAGIAYALQKMNDEGYRHIPMVDAQGRPAGIVAVRDIVRWLVDLFPDAVRNLPPDPAHEARSEDGG